MPKRSLIPPILTTPIPSTSPFSCPLTTIQLNRSFCPDRVLLDEWNRTEEVYFGWCRTIQLPTANCPFSAPLLYFGKKNSPYLCVFSFGFIFSIDSVFVFFFRNFCDFIKFRTHLKLSRFVICWRGMIGCCKILRYIWLFKFLNFLYMKIDKEIFETILEICMKILNLPSNSSLLRNQD